jgi:hypothetical protein
MTQYDKDCLALAELEALRECNPPLALAADIIAADPEEAAALFLALPSEVYPHAVRALLAEMDDSDRIALAVLLDNPEVEDMLEILVLLASPPSTED